MLEAKDTVLVRVWAFGEFQVDYQTQNGSWNTVEPQEWGGNAHSRHVLRYLLLHGRSAGRGSLMNAIWPGSDSIYLDNYLSKAVSNLRKVFRSQDADDFVRTKNERTLYELADQSVIWTDMDACEAAMQAAERLGHASEEGCRFLETAQTYFARGRLFEGEDGLWCYAKRDLFETAQYRCHLWLAEAYEVQGHLRQAEIQIEKLLHSNPLDETALVRLLALLQKQGMIAEAQRRYKSAAARFAQQGLSLSALTQTPAQPLADDHQDAGYAEPGMALAPLPTIQRPLTLPVVVQRPSEPVEYPLVLPSTNLALLLPLEVAPEDSATWLGIRLAYLLNVVHQWKPQAMACDILQALVDREIAMFDDLQKTAQQESFLLSRRQALITLASLPVMLTAPLLASLPYEEFLPQCAASVTACWHLLRGREFLLIEKLLTRYLPHLADMAHQPSCVYRTDAARLATQGYRLMGILALHRGGALARTAYFEQAVHFAEIAETPNLLAAALISLAYHEADPNKATEFYQRGAKKYKELSPLVLARLYARLAVVSAQRAQETDALHYLHQAQEIYPQAPEKDPCFLYAEFCPSSLTMEVGLTYLALAQQLSPGKYAQQAREIFAGVDSVRSPIPAPVRIRYEITNHEARTSLVMHDIEEFCSLLEKGMYGAKLLQSDQRKQEVLQLYKDARTQWPEETRVRALSDLVL